MQLGHWVCRALPPRRFGSCRGDERYRPFSLSQKGLDISASYHFTHLIPEEAEVLGRFHHDLTKASNLRVTIFSDIKVATGFDLGAAVDVGLGGISLKAYVELDDDKARIKRVYPPSHGQTLAFKLLEHARYLAFLLPFSRAKPYAPHSMILRYALLPFSRDKIRPTHILCFSLATIQQGTRNPRLKLLQKMLFVNASDVLLLPTSPLPYQSR